MSIETMSEEKEKQIEKNLIFFYGLLTGCFFWVGFCIAMSIILRIWH